MKKEVLLRVNALLGALSVALAGCHVQKKAAESQPQEEEEKTPVIEVKEPEVLYGAPVDFYPKEKEDTTIIRVKYGVPNPRR